MNLSISRRRKLIVEGSFQHGTQRSRHLLDCERFRTSFITGLLTRLLLHPSYLLSLVLKRLFLFNCNVSMLRLTTLLSLLSLPIALTRLLCYHKRERSAHPILSPSLEAIVLSAFPIAWFFGFLYYTEVPSVLFVVWTVVAASQDNHWIAALVSTMIFFN
jgi:DIE2/ALG10 family